MSPRGARERQARLEALEQRIGYAFQNRDLLNEAMTHASALDGKRGGVSYDRLEFLGDRVLGLIVSEHLLRDRQELEEGELAQYFNALVNRHACARAARAAGLGDAVILSPSEESSGGRAKEAILADLCEALIAALYLDAGIDAARAFVTLFWGEALDTAEETPRDPKTALQEWAAARRLGLSYEVVDRTGPEHAPHFVVDVRVEGFPPGRGEGGSKRTAQRAAAAAFLKDRGVGG